MLLYSVIGSIGAIWVIWGARDITSMMENQMENEMRTGVIGFIEVILGLYGDNGKGNGNFSDHGDYIGFI